MAPVTRIATSPATSNKTPKADKATAPAKKPKQTMVTKTFKTVSAVERYLTRQSQVWSAAAQKDNHALEVREAMIRIVHQAEGLKAKLTDMHTNGWVPPSGTSGQGPKAAIAEGVQVWIQTKKLAEYQSFFSSTDLDSLYVEKVYNGKILVRIGEEATGGKVRRMMGFVPKGHLTTARPVANTDEAKSDEA